jgi:NAD(P)-dependent dehydrogenase (short-subunit alcohol dehydrogenase family)
MLDEIEQSLEGQIAVVTGGASGIGRATCLGLVEKGASVVIVDINDRGLEETQHEIESSSVQERATVLNKDVRCESHMSEMAGFVLEKYGRIDILVHCAGILRGKDSGPRIMADVSVSEWDEVIDINLKGTFLCNRAVLPAMMKQRRGQIVNLASTSGLKGRAFDTVYCASKFGVVGLSQSLAEEARSHGIRVYLVSPDAIDTPMWEQNGPIHAPGNALPSSRVAGLITYLVSLPMDTIVGNVAIYPFRTRRRKKKNGVESS